VNRIKASSVVKQPFSRTLSKTSPPEHNLNHYKLVAFTRLSCRGSRGPQRFRRVSRCSDGPFKIIPNASNPYYHEFHNGDLKNQSLSVFYVGFVDDFHGPHLLGLFMNTLVNSPIRALTEFLFSITTSMLLHQSKG
jgi:hypothetical protein